MAKKIIRFNNFIWGIANNPYFISQWQYTDSKNLDIRSKAPLVIPSIWPWSASFTTSSGMMHTACENLFFGAGGKVYTTAGSNTHTVTGTPTIYSACKFGIKTVFVYEASSKVKLWYYDGSWTDSRAPTYWTDFDDTVSNGHSYPMVVFQDRLFIGNGTQLLSVSDGWVTTQELTWLSGYIKWLTASWQMIKLFLSNGDILFWDALQGTSYNEKLELKIPIRTVNNAGSYDYILAWERSAGQDTQLFRLNGYNIELVTTYQNGVELYTSEEGSNGKIAITNGLVFLPGALNSPNLWGVYTFGRFINSLVDSLVWQYMTSAGGYQYTEIGCIHYYQWKIYVGYKDSNNTYGIDIFNQDPNATDTKYNNGWIITPLFDGGARNTKKKIVEVRYHGNVWASDTVTIGINTSRYYLGAANRRKLLVDSQSWFTTIATINGTDSAEQNDVYWTAVDVEFYIAQLQISLQDWATLSEIEIVYEELT